MSETQSYPRCSTCKHWHDLAVTTGNRCCGWDKGDRTRPERRSDGVFVPDYQAIQTGPDFGCIHHESRDEPARPCALEGTVSIREATTASLVAEVERLKQRVAELERDMANEQHDVHMLARHCTRAYCWMTGDLVGKPHTHPETVIAIAEERRTTEIAEETAPLRTRVAELEQVQSRVAEVCRKTPGPCWCGCHVPEMPNDAGGQRSKIEIEWDDLYCHHRLECIVTVTVCRICGVPLTGAYPRLAGRRKREVGGYIETIPTGPVEVIAEPCGHALQVGIDFEPVERRPKSLASP